MKRHLFAIATLTALACSGLFAQTIPALGAKIPFDFAVGSKILPAGDYRITCDNGVLMLRNNLGKPAAMATTGPADDKTVGNATGLLQFQKYGDEYFLSALWAPGAPHSGRALSATARQKELARNSVRPTTTLLAAGK